MKESKAINLPLNGLDYYINIGYSRPIYIRPLRVEMDYLLLMKQYGNECGIYFLFKNGIVVYVGVSKKSVYDRIIYHLKDKNFDAYFILSANNTDGTINYNTLERCLANEKKLIEFFNPQYNSHSNLALRQVKLNENELSKIEG
jgi:hypothetical protein